MKGWKQKMVNRLKKTFKDNSRENLVNTLTNLGIKGEMLERGAMEEKIGDKWWTRRLGLISIEDNPITGNLMILWKQKELGNPSLIP